MRESTTTLGLCIRDGYAEYQLVGKQEQKYQQMFSRVIKDVDVSTVQILEWTICFALADIRKEGYAPLALCVSIPRALMIKLADNIHCPIHTGALQCLPEFNKRVSCTCFVQEELFCILNAEAEHAMAVALSSVDPSGADRRLLLRCLRISPVPFYEQSYCDHIDRAISRLFHLAEHCKVQNFIADEPSSVQLEKAWTGELAEAGVRLQQPIRGSGAACFGAALYAASMGEDAGAS